MSINRWATRTDTTQAAIVEAIRKAGWKVWVIKLPVDLLCWHPGADVWQPLECKTPTKSGKAKLDKRQEEQNRFCDETFTPRVTTPEQAVEFLNRRLGK
jgi:hypothetical protein